MPEVAVGQRRVANLMPLTDKQLRDAQRDLVYIFNVSPYPQTAFVEKQYTIPAREKGKRVSEALVIPGVVYSTVYKGGEYQWVGRDGIEVAQEIIGTFRMLDPSQNITKLGVFISDTPEPSEEAIAAAEAVWFERCSQKVAEGDQLAAINGGVVDIGGGRTASNIGKDHRIALEEIGQKRPWSGTNAKMLICEECGESNMPAAARCKNAECRCIFDEAKCRIRFPEMFAHEEIKRQRPPKEVAA